jgi:hypothetical protein
MKVLITTVSKRVLGDLRELDILKFFGALLSAFVAFYYFHEQVAWLSPNTDNISDNIESVNSLPKALASFFGTIVAIYLAINDFKKWRPVFKNCIHAFLIKPRRQKRVKYFFGKKIRDDLFNSPVKSSFDIIKSLDESCITSQSLCSIAENRGSPWLNNKQIWTIDETYKDNLLVEKIIREFESEDDSLWTTRYNEEINELRKLKADLETEQKLEMHVAAVQPAFYLEADRICRSAGLGDNITIATGMKTGPANMEFGLKKVTQSKSFNKVIVLVAPLSAFSTTELQNSDSELVDPRDYFSPVLTLTKELQHIYFVESGTSSPVSKRDLYYLDNSTAEECVAVMDLGQRLIDVFNPRPVKDYEDYKSLLLGKTIENNGCLRPGDAIVLWSPLIDYFDGNRVDTNHLSKDHVALTFGKHMKSDIMLFVENDWSQKSVSVQKLTESFIKALSLGVAIRHKSITEKRRKSWKRMLKDNFYQNRAYKNIYKSRFIELFKQ